MRSVSAFGEFYSWIISAKLKIQYFLYIAFRLEDASLWDQIFGIAWISSRSKTASNMKGDDYHNTHLINGYEKLLKLSR